MAEKTKKAAKKATASSTDETIKPDGIDHPVQPTSAAAWGAKAEEGVVVELPSGNFARLKRTMDMIHLMKAGRLPNPLGMIVQRMIDENKAIDTDDIDPAGAVQMLRFIDDIVVKAFVEPKIAIPPYPEEDEDEEAFVKRFEAWQPPKDHLNLAMIDIDDRMFVFAFAQGMASDLQSFREETAGSLAPLSTITAVARQTVESGGAG